MGLRAFGGAGLGSLGLGLGLCSLVPSELGQRISPSVSPNRQGERDGARAWGIVPNHGTLNPKLPGFRLKGLQ